MAKQALMMTLLPNRSATRGRDDDARETRALRRRAFPFAAAAAMGVVVAA
jgi:hypothetical protein